MARIYYRIQPAGLEIAGHRSEASDDVLHAGIDAFCSATNTLNPDGWKAKSTDEVLVLSAERHWDNGDVEGVRVDPQAATVVARLSWQAWLDLCRELAEIPPHAKHSHQCTWEDDDSLWEVGSDLDEAIDAHFEALRA
jgi:hypothetical protein